LLQVVRTHQQNPNASLPRTAHKCQKNTKEREMGKERDARTVSPRSLDMLVDREQTYRWLKFGDIKTETKSLIVAAQDQALGTNYLKRKVLKEETESKCRLCEEYEETIYQ
jgi:hypothetical protein